MTWTVNKKLMGGFISILFILVIIIGISFSGLKSVDDGHTYSLEKAQLAYNLKKMQVEVKQEIIITRGYLITDDKSALQNVTVTHDEFQKEYDTLSQMIKEPKAVKLLKEIYQLEQEYNQHANHVFKLKSQNKLSENTALISTQESDIIKRFDKKIAELTLFQEELLNQHLAETSAMAQSIKTWIIILGIVSVLVGIGIALLIGRIITKPISIIAADVKRIADGDLTVDEIKVKNRDEIGDLAQSFNGMAGHLRHVIEQVSLHSTQVVASSEELTASAEQASKATEQIASTMQEVAAGTDNEMNAMEDTSQTIYEMNISVQQIANYSEVVSNTAMEASDKASQGGEAIQTAVQQMNSINQTVQGLSKIVKGLGKRSNEIDQISQVITEIADQTNLLALNAAIEAARAGEYGLGFSVVAEEVRKLAEQSANSAQQISQLIVLIQGETNKAVHSMEVATNEVTAGIRVIHHAGESFKVIENSINEVTTQIQEVSSSVQQMAAGEDQMAQSIRLITDMSETVASSTQEVSAATEEQFASMEEITAAATSLSEMAEDLQTIIGKFKV